MLEKLFTNWKKQNFHQENNSKKQGNTIKKCRKYFQTGKSFTSKKKIFLRRKQIFKNKKNAFSEENIFHIGKVSLKLKKYFYFAF